MAEQLSNWFSQSLDGLLFKREARQKYAGGCLDMALEHHDAIVILIKNGIYGSALSLLRLAFESYIRGVWLLKCAKDNDLKRFSKDKPGRSVAGMIADIQSLPANEGNAVLSESWKDAKTLLHSFTHSGLHQVSRRYGDQGIEASYPEDELQSALDYANGVSIMCVIAFADLCADNNLALAAREKAKEYSAL